MKEKTFEELIKENRELKDCISKHGDELHEWISKHDGMKTKVQILEQEVKRLERMNLSKQERLDKLENEAKCLANRCYVLSKGSTCAFCELKETKCEHMPFPEEKAKMVDKIMHETLGQLVERLENEEDEE